MLIFALVLTRKHLISKSLTHKPPLLLSLSCRHKHFSALLVSFEIGSNLVGPLLVSKGKSLLCVKKNAIKLLALKEPEQIFTRTRVSLIIDAALIILTSNGYPIFNLLSSIQARACLTLLHFNCNRAGLTPMGLHYLYIWAFGLSSWHNSLSTKRICEPTLNTIRGL